MSINTPPANAYEVRAVGGDDASPETKAMNRQAYETNNRLERDGFKLDVSYFEVNRFKCMPCSYFSISCLLPVLLNTRGCIFGMTTDTSRTISILEGSADNLFLRTKHPAKERRQTKKQMKKLSSTVMIPVTSMP
jgi:hypothetical protein